MRTIRPNTNSHYARSNRKDQLETFIKELCDEDYKGRILTNETRQLIKEAMEFGIDIPETLK
jgi:hypothetical protein